MDGKNEADREERAVKERTEKILYHVHGRFINESDFPKGGVDAYRNWIDLYIAYKYEPIDEEYEETRYFTEDFESSFTNK